jgi:hypothetical protein
VGPRRGVIDYLERNEVNPDLLHTGLRESDFLQIRIVEQSQPAPSSTGATLDM